jgi:hypothetical protein
MIFWYLIDPAILVEKVVDDIQIPRDNYAYIYAESDAITALLFLDMRYLYKGKESFQISLTNFAVHWVTSLILIVTSPLSVFPMLMWLSIAAFQILVIYLYSTIILDNREEEVDYAEIDVYY